MPLKADIESKIETAFHHVTLDGGLSLNQTKVIDKYGRDCSPERFAALPLREVTDDWNKIPAQELDEADALAHLDEKGFRYYIPALMLRLLDNYDPASMMSIGTLSMLYPKTKSKEYLYSELSEDQKKAIALYLNELPGLIKLDDGDRVITERAIRNYWSKYL